MKTANSNQQLAVSSEPTTVDVYRPVATLDAEHRRAFAELQSAVARSDEVAMKQAFDAITYIEQRQRVAHQAVRAHALKKVRS